MNRSKNAATFPNIIHRKPRVRCRGVPPPPNFDLAKLAPTQILTLKETAAVIRRPEATLISWRHHRPDHPLKWRKQSGRIVYTVQDIRAYLQT